MYKSVILPLAKQDIKDAAKWYNDRKPGLGKVFTREIRKKVGIIRQNPHTVAIRYDNIRTSVLDIFPYMIHFEIDENKKSVVIFAVFNTHRDPEIWKERG